MASLTRMCMKYRRVRPASSISAMLATAQLQRATAPPHPTLFADLEDLHGRRVASTAIVDISATQQQQQQQQDTAALDGAVTAKQLWAASRVVSRSKEVRASLGACVVGGANTIRRVWRDYGLRPNVVYLPNTSNSLPEWCVGEELPTYLVRCPPVTIKKQLLSAEYSDGFAAEFPWSSDAFLTPLASLMNEVDGDGGEASSPAAVRVGSMAVLVGLRIPSNVGTLIRAAVDMGYESVLLVDCVDPFNEKVIRASEGTVFSPRLKLFQKHTEVGESCVNLLSAIAARHGLLPLLAVPSQDAEPAFVVAKRMHSHNLAVKKEVEAGGPQPLGPMLLLGSEAHGLGSLDGEWSVPYQVLTLPLPNAAIDSYNVSVAGSILLHLFRASAAASFEKLGTLHGEAPEKVEFDAQASLSE